MAQRISNLTVYNPDLTLYTGNTSSKLTKSGEEIHPVVDFFDRHQGLILDLIRECLQTVGNRFRDLLTVENVMSETFLRLSEIPESDLTDEIISFTVNRVLGNKGQDKNTATFDRHNIIASRLAAAGTDDVDQVLDAIAFSQNTLDSTPARVHDDGDRIKLLKLRPFLLQNQIQATELLAQGLSVNEVAELTGRHPQNVRRSLGQIKIRAAMYIAELDEPLAGSGINKELWADLSPRQRGAMDIHLLGIDGRTNMEHNAFQNDKALSRSLFETRQKLGIDANDIFEIRRKQLKHNAGKETVQETFLRFLYPGCIPEPNDKDSPVNYRKELFTSLCRLLAILPKEQRHSVSLYIQGFRTSEIAEITGRDYSSVEHSLLYAKKNLQACVEKLNTLKCPEGIDRIRWARMPERRRNIVIDFLSGMKVEDIARKNSVDRTKIWTHRKQAEKELNISEDRMELMRRGNPLAVETPLGIDETKWTLLPLLVRNIVSEYLSGKKITEIESRFRISKSEVHKSINEACDKLQLSRDQMKRLHDSKLTDIECPIGINNTVWSELQILTKNALSEYLSGLTYTEISNKLGFSTNTVSAHMKKATGLLNLTVDELQAIRLDTAKIKERKEAA